MATLDEEEIVISGISGRYPDSDNVQELWENLLNHVNMVNNDERRWKNGFLLNTNYSGKLKDITAVDSEFFNAKSDMLSESSFLSWNFLFEVIYEAIIDSGRSTESIAETKTAVIVDSGSQMDLESRRFQVFNNNKPSMLNMFHFLPNIVTHMFNLKGEGMTVETACSTGLTALEIARNSIKMGRADYAIVACSLITLAPFNSLAFESLGNRSKSGACRAFDDGADGFVRSDGIVACFLEKAKSAKRIYCSILECQSNCNGFHNKGIVAPSQELQTRLLQDVLHRSGITPVDITYMEGHGTGTVTGDYAEVAAMTDVYCKNRQEPLLIGSIKSNIGHAEMTSALCAITKIILTMEREIIPANLHFKKPNSRLPALVNGQLKVVSQNTSWNGGLIALNCFGVGGTNSHAIFRPNPKVMPKIKDAKKLKLFAYTTRTKEGLELMLKSLETNPDPYLYGLLSSSMEEPDPHMYWKGYTILNSKTRIRKMELACTESRPVCFLYTGFGCQWTGMGRTLLEIDVCRESVIKSFQYLKVQSSDIIQFICNQDIKEDSFTNRWMRSALVTAIQIALTDLLKLLDINPDFIIGLSVGEIVSAYADGCITQEQAMLLTYHLAKTFMDKNTSNWKMVHANVSPDEASKDLPPGISVICHNSEDSVTLSGQEKILSQHLKQLSLKNICFSEVYSLDFGLHCKILDQTRKALCTEFSKIITNPKPRSSRWISTSITTNDSALAKTFTVDYLINNFAKPVFFYEGLQKVQRNSVFIEISPDSILRNHIKRTAGLEGKYISFMGRKANNMNVLLSNIGELYVSGLRPKISRLYPTVDFPVPKGTCMISSLLRWDHTKPKRCSLMQDTVDYGATSLFRIELLRGMFSFVVDHNINGQVVFPPAGYLFLAWNKFAIHKFSKFDVTPVVFEDVQFLKDLTLTQSGIESLMTMYNKTSGKFEIYHNKDVYAVGIARSPRMNVEQTDIDLIDTEICEKLVTKEDIYKILRLLGFYYGDNFQNIITASVDGTKGMIKWKNNWITFLDSMMQLPLLSMDIKDLFLLKKIDYLYINPIKHREYVKSSKEELLVKFHPDKGKIQSGGIIGKGFGRKKISTANEPEILKLEEYKFLPYFDDRCFADLKEFEDDLENYNYVCEAYIKLIMQGVENFPKNIVRKSHLDDVSGINSEPPISSVERFLNNTDLKTYLLEQLLTLWKTSQSWSHDLISDFAFKEEQEDFLLSAFLNDLMLRTLLDVALENTFSVTVKVMEIWSSNAWMTQYLHSFFQNLPDRQVNYTIGHSEITEWENEFFQKKNLDTMDWDVTSNSLNNKNTDIIIGYYTLSKRKSNIISVLNNIRNSLKEGGFAVMIEPKENSIIGYFLNDYQNTSYFQHNQEDLVRNFKESNFEIAAQKSDGLLYDIYLLKNISKASLPRVVIPIGDDNLEQWIPNIQNCISDEDDSDVRGNIWLVSKNCACSGIIGLTKCLSREPPYGPKIRCLYEITEHDSSQGFTEKDEIPKDIIKKDLLVNIYKNGQWGSLRHTALQKVDLKISVSNAILKMKTPGDFGSFHWCEKDIDEPSNSKVICVYYAGLSYRDVVCSKEKSQFGYDFSGRDLDGRRVMGITPSSALTTRVASDSKYIWTVPENWTLAEAATVPLAYILAYYALNVMGNLRIGDKVLIHSGTGAVGQAAINVALSMSCEVFVTVGSEEKRTFLMNHYSGLKKENILKSTDLSFESEIMKRTNGKGIDMIFNSLTKQKMIASFRCLAENGHFLNIGKSTLPSNCNLDILLQAKEYIDIKFDSLFKNAYHFDETERHFVNGLQNGTVKPINKVLFKMKEIADAFLLLQNHHIGKVVIEIRKEESSLPCRQPETLLMPAVPKVTFPSDGTVIMVGAFGGFGMEMTRWLVNRGVRNLVLNSRRGIVNGYQEHYVDMFRRSGINIHISTDNLIDKSCAAALVEKANEMGPVIAIFNLALILKDDLFPKQSPEVFRRVTDVKIQISKNLHELSRRLCPLLKYFVMFSSQASSGSPGQTNYAYGNAAIERLCEERQAMGLPGLAIQWGIVGEVGYTHEKFGPNFQIGNYAPQKISSCLAVLDVLFKQKAAVVGSYALQSKTVTSKKSINVSFKDVLQSCIGVDYNTLNKDALIVDLGIDSLTMTELMAAIEQNWKLTFEIQDISTLTLAKIEERIKNLEK